MNNHQTLSSVPVGQWVKLERINAGRRITHRLAELGLTPGIELCIIQDTGGPLIISVRGSRIAIGRGIANKIQVAIPDMPGTNQNRRSHLQVNQIPHENTTRRFGRKSKRRKNIPL